MHKMCIKGEQGEPMWRVRQKEYCIDGDSYVKQRGTSVCNVMLTHSSSEESFGDQSSLQKDTFKKAGP